MEGIIEERTAASGGLESSESAASVIRFRRSVFEAREPPTPTPTESESTTTEAAPVPTSVVGIVFAAAAEFGISGDYLLAVASCESGLDTGAYNAAGYYGLFQFDLETWAAYGYGSIYDPTAQARTAARLLAAGQSERWPNCA